MKAQKQRLGFSWGVIGVVCSLTLSIWVSMDTFLDPVVPYVSFHYDKFIALIYLIAFIVAALFFLGKKPHGLVILVGLIATFVILVVLRNAQIRSSLLLLTWFLIVSWIIGDFFLKRIVSTTSVSLGERVVLSIVLGWGVLVVATVILGIAGLYQSWLIYTLFFIITLWGFWQYSLNKRKLSALTCTMLRRKCRIFAANLSIKKMKMLNSHFHILAISIMLVVAIGSFLWAIAPAVRYDSLSYHLAVPMRYIVTGRMVAIPESVQTYWAHYGEMLYTLAFLLGDQPLPSLINFCAGVLLTIQTYYLGKHLKNKTVGILSALIFCSLPIIGMEAATTYIDIFVALFVMAALQATYFWLRGYNERWLILVGIFSGLAIGTKITAFLLLVPFWGLLIFSAAQSGDGVKVPLRELGVFAVKLVCPAFIILAPWLIRDWLWTGNPIFPNYNNIFHSPQWFERSFFYVQASSTMLSSFLVFPWRGITNSIHYYHEAPGAVLGALPMLSLPWFYGWYPWSKDKRRVLLLLFLASLMGAMLVASMAYNVRYILPLFGLLSIFAAINLEMLGDVLFRRQKHLGMLFAALIFIYFFSTRLAFSARWWEIPERYPVQVALGLESQDEFIERILPVYGAFSFLNQQGTFKVLSIGNELRLYTDSQIYGPFFSKEAYLTLHDASIPEELAQNLEDGAYKYILIYPPEQNHRPEIYHAPALTQEFFARYTRLEYIHRQVYLYRFYPQGVDRSQDNVVNMLQNASFETGDVENWLVMGTSYQISDDDVYQGHFALKLPGPETSAYQDVLVTPGEIYTLGYWAKSVAADDEQKIQLYIQWLDANEQPVGTSADWVAMTDSWKPYQLSATAPEDAALARVYVSVVNEGQTWFDDLCFVQGDLCP